MTTPGRRGVQHVLACLALLVTGCARGPVGSADAADAERGKPTADTGTTSGGDTGGTGTIDVVIPSADISLPAGKFIEIDDLTGTASGSRDANLCSSSTNADYDTSNGDACPGGPLTTSAGLTDNPNFPGPNPAAPDTLGTDDSAYVDWAELDPAKYLAPFVDKDVDPDTLQLISHADDDIFSPGECVNDSGSSPSKANFTTTAFAANSEYFYLLNERQASNGNEAYHYFATQSEPTLDVTPGSCGGATWMWHVQDGDVQIKISYPSTSGLPTATATVYQWSGGDQDLNAEDLTNNTNWTVISGSVAYVAINVNGTDHKALPGEDTEKDFDGDTLASGLKVEAAIDIAAVFGAGCGLKRTISGVSTASEGGNDDLKDFLSPVTVETGSLSADLTLSESCDEEFGYDLAVTLETDSGTSDVTTSPDLDVDLVVDCDGTANDKTISDPDLPSGTVSIPVSSATGCSVQAVVNGVSGGDLDQCSTDTTTSVSVYPVITASGSLDGDCDGTVSYDGSILSDGSAIVSSGDGSPDFDVAWSFTVGGVSGASTDDQLDGGFTAASSGSSAKSVSGTLTVSDLRERDTDGDGTADTFCDDVTASAGPVNAYRPLAVELVPTTGDGTCEPDGNANVQGVNFDARITGGSGNYIVDWTLADDADLDSNDLSTGACADLETAASGTTADIVDSDQSYSKSCSFDIGTDFCASGTVTLQVTDTDPECTPQSDSITADRTSSLDVTPDPI